MYYIISNYNYPVIISKHYKKEIAEKIAKKLNNTSILNCCKNLYEVITEKEFNKNY
jgi:hypothetical protein